ncbi:MAG: DNA polymerase III subunit alpha, partial [Sphingomonadales bacterium]
PLPARPHGNIPVYINRKHGLEAPEYLHESLEGILKETYGVIIYQEQVMQIAQILADYSLGEADILRRAMGKKKKKEMDAQRKRFVDGAEKKGVANDRAEFIFNLVAKFAGYGFNKSHAAAYALVAYQTAWMKANYPVEFVAASMTLDQHNTDKLDSFKKDLQHLEIPLLPPNINKSGATFTVEPAGEQDEEAETASGDARVVLGVRYALAAVRNVGEKAMAAVVAEREKAGPFKDAFDFAGRLDVRQINKRQLENLIAAGAFDSLNPNRAQLMQSVEMLLREAHAATEARESHQVSLFGEETVEVEPPNLPEVPPWSESELLKRERLALGFYMSSHPLEIHARALKRHGVKAATEVLESDQYVGQEVFMAGVIDGLRERRSKKGKPYGHMALSDISGGYEVLVFSDKLDQARLAKEEGGPVLIKVSVDKRGGDDRVGLMLRSLETLEQVAERTPIDLEVHIREASSIPILANILKENRGGHGHISLAVLAMGGTREVHMKLPEAYKVTPELRSAIMACPGVAYAREV